MFSKRKDEDEYIKQFYDSLTACPRWEEKAKTLRSFLTEAIAFHDPPGGNGGSSNATKPLSFLGSFKGCIVTSGSVATPLDTEMVNYLDTLGSGNRGAACCEAFLSAGYYVVFLYREGSLRPFSRLLAKRLKKSTSLVDQIRINEETGQIELALDDAEKEKVQTMMARYAAFKHRLLEISFTDLYEYLYLFRQASEAVKPFGHNAVLFLTAGLGKKYIPKAELQNPTSSVLDDGKAALKFAAVPHVIRQARKNWCPLAFLVAFKLDFDPISLSEKAHEQLERHGLHMVVGNAVKTRGAQVLLVTEREEVNLVSDKVQELEASMVRAVVKNHKHFTLEREALRDSKSLLSLSAKFCMYRSEKSVIDQDADGNKNVPFRVGLRIKGNRRSPNSPIYELISIYNNKSGSARCHVWKRVSGASGPVVEPSGSTGGNGNSNGLASSSSSKSLSSLGGDGDSEILVTFSPAGTPDTILTVFDDAWTGWLEEEVKTLFDSVKKIPLSTYLNILASPVTADFSDAALLLDRFIKSLSSAWRERERTQFIQAMGNLMNIGFDRGLSTLEGLADARDIANLVHMQGIRNSITAGIVPMTALSPVRVESLKEVVVPKPVFRGHSEKVVGATGDDDEDEEELIEKAQTVRVHNTVKRYFSEMMEEGVLEDVLKHVEADPGCRVIVTGYSLGGMLSQIFVLKLGEALLVNNLSTRNVRMLTFGSPRVGDEGLKARLRLLYPTETRLMNVIYPLDTVHAFPPSSEGYADCVVKVFLRQPGQFVGRRSPAKTIYATPLTWLRILDTKFDEVLASSQNKKKQQQQQQQQQEHLQKEKEGQGSGTGPELEESEEKGDRVAAPVTGAGECCGFCGLESHTTQRHRCSKCTERGAHRAKDCPNKDKGCSLCGLMDHCTGEHICSVCKLRGHRGRYCHEMRSVGWTELASYCLFHDFWYYSIATAQEDDAYQPKLLSSNPSSPGPSPPISPKGRRSPQPSSASSSAQPRVFGVFGGRVLDEKDIDDLQNLNQC